MGLIWNLLLRGEFERADEFEPYSRSVEDASKCLAMGCSTVTKRHAAKVAAQAFGMDDVQDEVAREWCLTLQSFSKDNYDCQVVFEKLKRLLESLDPESGFKKDYLPTRNQRSEEDNYEDIFLDEEDEDDTCLS